MRNKGIISVFIGLFLCTAAGAQSRVPIVRLTPVQAGLWDLLVDYQSRFLHGTLTRVEFEYAHQWICPKFPDLPADHLCNSSVVGTSGEIPPDAEPGETEPVLKLPPTVCLKCILIQK